MGMEENRQLVERGYQLFARQDIDGLLALTADDIEWIGFDNPDLPFAGTWRGRQEVGQFFGELASHMQPVRFEPREMLCERDRVVVLGQALWRLTANGREIETDWVHVFEVRDGKIRRFQHFDDGVKLTDAFRELARTGMAGRKPAGAPAGVRPS